jgi:hypothetical protein
MSAGSMQLRIYRRARRDGLSRLAACEMSSIGLKEAAFTDADDERNPPAPDCFVLPAPWLRNRLTGLADLPLGLSAIERLSA